MLAAEVSSFLPALVVTLMVATSHATFLIDKDKGYSAPAMPHVVVLPAIVDHSSFHHRPAPYHGNGNGYGNSYGNSYGNGYGNGFGNGGSEGHNNQVGWHPHQSYLAHVNQHNNFGHVQNTNFNTKVFQHNQVFPQAKIFSQPITPSFTNVFSQPQIFPQHKFFSAPSAYQPYYPVQHQFLAPTPFFSGVPSRGPLFGGDAVAASHYASGLLHAQAARAANPDPSKKGGKFKGFFVKKFRSDDDNVADSSTFVHKKIHKQPIIDQQFMASSLTQQSHGSYRPHHLQKVKEFIFEKGNNGMKMQKVLEFDFSRANQGAGNQEQADDQTPHNVKKRSTDSTQTSNNPLHEKELEHLKPSQNADKKSINNRSSRYIPPPVLHRPLLRPLHRPLLPLRAMHHRNVARANLNIARANLMTRRRTPMARNFHQSTNYYPGRFVGGRYRPPVRTGFYRLRRNVNDEVTTVAPETLSPSPRSNSTARSDEVDEADKKLEAPNSSHPPARGEPVPPSKPATVPPGFPVSPAMLPRHFQPHHFMHHGAPMMHMQPAYHPHEIHPGLAPGHHYGPAMHHGGMVHSSYHPMLHGHLIDPRIANPTHLAHQQPPVHIHVTNSNSHPPQSHHFTSSSHSQFNGHPGHQMGNVDHMQSSHHFVRADAKPMFFPPIPTFEHQQFSPHPPHFIHPDIARASMM